MSLTYPYPLSFLANCLNGGETRVYPNRYESMYGSRDGRYFGAEINRPLWAADIALDDRPPAEARRINALVWALGVNKPFLFADPYYAGPISGTSGLAAVTISSIASSRGNISLAGLPAGFTLSAGDFFSLVYSGSRVYFGAVLEGPTAASNGTATTDIWPELPLPVVTGTRVELVAPYFKAIIPPDGFTGYGNVRGGWGTGASISVVQKI